MKAFNAECLRRGVLKGPQKIYMSLAHTPDDVARVLEVFKASLGSLPRQRRA